MVLTRRARLRINAAALLEQVPHELLLYIGRLSGAHAQVQLSVASKALRSSLSLQLARYEQFTQAIKWVPMWTRHCIISDSGLTLTRQGHDGSSPREMVWAAGGLLPTRGRYSWCVRIDASAGNTGAMSLGVCDGAAEFSCAQIDIEPRRATCAARHLTLPRRGWW